MYVFLYNVCHWRQFILTIYSYHIVCFATHPTLKLWCFRRDCRSFRCIYMSHHGCGYKDSSHMHQCSYWCHTTGGAIKTPVTCTSAATDVTPRVRLWRLQPQAPVQLLNDVTPRVRLWRLQSQAQVQLLNDVTPRVRLWRLQPQAPVQLLNDVTPRVRLWRLQSHAPVQLLMSHHGG